MSITDQIAESLFTHAKEAYQPELDKQICPIHNKSAQVVKVESKPYDIQFCCRDQQVFVNSFLNSRAEQSSE